MRFLLAATILAQSLPAATASSIDATTTTTNVLIVHQQPNDKFLPFQQPNVASKPTGQHEYDLRRQARRRLQNALKTRNATSVQERPITTQLRNKKTESITSTEQECDPDIGILSCGVSEYCIKSDLTSLGGLCVSEDSFHDLHRRSLQSDFFPPPSVCDPSRFEASNYDCNCENFDLAQNVGEFTCTLDEYVCKRDNLCGNNEVTHTVSENGASASYCYGFEKPYDISLCYTVDTERNCNISVQNEECAECEIVDRVVHPVYGFVGYNCYEFDCTNTLAGIKGNNCAGNYVLDALSGLTMPSSSPSTPFPSSRPSASPSVAPSLQPSSKPTVTASSHPTPLPSFSPSTRPSLTPTDVPSQKPSAIPSIIPSNSPSTAPSVSPTVTHSEIPTMLPSAQPSMQPSQTPSSVPTRIASDQPSLKPSESPSIATSYPSQAPTFEPWNVEKEDKAERSRGQEADSSASALGSSLCLVSAILLGTLL